MRDVPSTGRLAAIDELRALAVMSMVLAHFGPGIIERVPALGAYRDAVLVWGHFATVTFILVFGITVGFVHYERFYSDDRKKIVSRLHARTRLVFICAILIGIPGFAKECSSGRFEFIPCLLEFYSPLNFYVLGFLSAPFWLGALGQQPLRNALLLAIANWVAGVILLAIWPLGSALDASEYLRMTFVSGPFAYFQLAGYALAVMPIGIYIRKSLRDGTYARLMLVLIVLGFSLTIGGWALGQSIHEFNIHAINTGELKAPPRLWYWMFFAGPTLLLLAGLVFLELRVAAASTLLYPVALFGMGALPIYTAHIFVLPALDFMSTKIVIEGLARIFIPFAAFGGYCLFVMYYHHYKLRRRRLAA